MSLRSLHPATDETIHEYPEASSGEVAATLTDGIREFVNAKSVYVA